MLVSIDWRFESKALIAQRRAGAVPATIVRYHLLYDAVPALFNIKNKTTPLVTS